MNMLINEKGNFEGFEMPKAEKVYFIKPFEAKVKNGSTYILVFDADIIIKDKYIILKYGEFIFFIWNKKTRKELLGSVVKQKDLKFYDY